MALSGMSADELIGLGRCLLSAIDGDCIPDWELEALLGCSRSEARELVKTGLSAGGSDERFVDLLVVLLSALSGSAQLSSVTSGTPPRRATRRSRPGDGLDLTEVHLLLAKLLGMPVAPAQTRPRRTPELDSQVKLRVPHARTASKKRPA